MEDSRMTERLTKYLQKYLWSESVYEPENKNSVTKISIIDYLLSKKDVSALVHDIVPPAKQRLLCHYW